MVGGILFPVGMWWFSWTQFGNVHWIVPEIALVFIILGICASTELCFVWLNPLTSRSHTSSDHIFLATCA